MTTTATETVHVVVGMGEDDEPYAWECGPGDYEDSEHHFEVDVPADLWSQVTDASSAWRSALAAICDVVGLDSVEFRLEACCPAWVGSTSKPMRFFEVWMGSSGSDDEWPVRGFAIHHEDTQEAAERYLADLPEEFYVHYGAWPLTLVTKDRLSIHENGWRGSTSTCYRCGWSKDDHIGATS